MRIRADSVFISSLLFTASLLSLVPAALRNALAGGDEALLAQMDDGFRAAAQTLHYLGLACVAMILVGLIVVWAGYMRRSSSAWFVMFVIVWFWAFPLIMLPFVSALVHGRIALTFSETLYDAISEWGSPRSAVESVLIFSSMVIALFLPIKRFLSDREGEKPPRRLSPRLIGFSVLTVLVILGGLYAWIRVGALYEIPVTELNTTQRLPASPPLP